MSADMESNEARAFHGQSANPIAPRYLRVAAFRFTELTALATMRTIR